jgi:hypothetical protein
MKLLIWDRQYRNKRTKKLIIPLHSHAGHEPILKIEDSDRMFLAFIRTANLYVQVTMHRDNLHINNQQDASSIQNFTLSRNSTCFRHLLCPSLGVISCTRGNWYVSCGFQPDSPRQRPHNLHETYQLPHVQLTTPDDGHRRCPKPVEFRDKIKFWILDASCWLFIWSKPLLFFLQQQSKQHLQQQLLLVMYTNRWQH